MSDITQKAQYLIDKGKEIGDEEMIKMGQEMLGPVKEKIQYKCTNCGNEIESDKKRKKCPNCGKHKLQIKDDKPNVKKSDIKSQFTREIRDNKSKKYVYDDDGNIVGTLAQSRNFSGFENTWKDEDVTEFNDEANKKLKAVTKVSTRTRSPTKKKEVQCESCKKTFYVHPIHISGRGRYLCDRCVGRRSQF